MIPRARRAVMGSAFMLFGWTVLIMSVTLLNLVMIRTDVLLNIIQDTNRIDSSRRRELIEMAQTATTDMKVPRSLVGIFSRDDEAGVKQRQHYREMIQNRSNDTRICSLPQFRERQKGLHLDECMVVYTFVVGAHRPDDTTVPTEIVDNRLTEYKILVDHIPSPYSSDVNLPDVTRLNIRENDNDGKTQTFLYYAYRDVMGNGRDLNSPLIEYCMKISPNAFVSLDRFLKFALEELHPAPFHRGVMVGALRDKAYGMSSDNGRISREAFIQSKDEDMPRLESYWGHEYSGVHLYMSGQLFMLSYDLIAFVLTEAPLSRERIAPGGYVVGHDGHDISSMAFHSPTPLHIITISKSQRFWTHPLRSDDQWERVVANELSIIADKRKHL